LAVEQSRDASPGAAVAPGAAPKVGVVLAFTGHYSSVRVIARFLELMGVSVARSRFTTPRILEAGTTLTSVDLCLPLRVYVGHVHHLLHEHPDLQAIVAPNVLSEDGRSSTCAKYRDIGGVAIRSLCGSLPYLVQHEGGWAKRLAGLVGGETMACPHRIPRFLMPDIHLLDELEMRNICYNVYADIMQWSRARKALLLLPRREGSAVARLEQAAGQAYAEIVARPASLHRLLADEEKPRLALVGRPYLVDDPVLTCDLKRWFAERGVSVITARDVPAGHLRLDDVDGYYDSHREGQAFIHYIHDVVDGVICLGCFGCHPDAFQVDHLAEYARSFGAACWTFRFDESASLAGFHTRFETILAFLQQRRDERLRNGSLPNRGKRGSAPMSLARAGIKGDHGPQAALLPAVARRPLFTWPYMGEIINLGLAEAGYQLGLAEYLEPPAVLSERAMLLGSERYTESCSPYAYSTGSLKDTLARVATASEEQLRAGQKPEPRRIIMIMLHGEGPCTFGWYSLMQRREIPAAFQERLAACGHTVEMATAGMQGLADFARQLYEAGKAPRLRPILDFLGARSAATGLLAHSRSGVRLLRFLVTVWSLSRPVWAKVDAAERLRARSLILRAHELRPGSVAAAYQEALGLLGREHTVRGIARAERKGYALLEAVSRDKEIKPRVATVGEIYVALTSFANRGTVETLLAREGLEVVEAITVAGFARHSLREIKRRALRGLWFVRPLLQWLRRHNLHPRLEHLRDALARPFLVHEVGGDGVPTVGGARRYVEQGCDGIVHLHPFKCMPEAIAKDAVKEIARTYGVRYLALDFNRETDIERLRTEVATFAALLRAEAGHKLSGGMPAFRRLERLELARRRAIGRLLAKSYASYRRPRHTD
jgi:predicted nucleotide-binding protein (sugar kinase/HSP70/actin superfamily)